MPSHPTPISTNLSYATIIAALSIYYIAQLFFSLSTISTIQSPPSISQNDPIIYIFHHLAQTIYPAL